MKVSEIIIYPVKSLKGIGLRESLVENRGLRFDRRWMLVDEKNQFLTQREYPKMATVGVEMNGEGLVVAANGSSINVPPLPETDDSASVAIWTSKVKARIYDDATNEWFSDVLGGKVRLVVMPEESKRKVNPYFAVRKFQDTVSFADGYPFLLIGEGSLEDLNSRLPEPLPMNRFRPNLVVSGSVPFEEDTWKRIRIGETEFHVVKPCARCVITTVDQKKGEKDGKEPLKTLASFRNRRGKVLFGQNLIAETPGSVVKIGDEVEVIETK
jgi:uncharacterized protein YcbX